MRAENLTGDGTQSGSQENEPARRAARRTVIRNEAARIFAVRGFHGASVQEIADALGLTKASLYYYYRSKEEMLYDILSYADREVTALLSSVEHPEPSPLSRIGRIVEMHVTWYLRHPDTARVVHRDAEELSGTMLDQQRKRRERYGNVLKEHIEQCRQAGLIPASVDVTMAANFINGAVSAINNWFNPGGSRQPEEIGRAFGQMAMATLAGLSPASVDHEKP